MASMSIDPKLASRAPGGSSISPPPEQVLVPASVRVEAPSDVVRRTVPARVESDVLGFPGRDHRGSACGSLYCRGEPQ